jgi:hypothetical protein
MGGSREDARVHLNYKRDVDQRLCRIWGLELGFGISGLGFRFCSWRFRGVVVGWTSMQELSMTAP